MTDLQVFYDDPPGTPQIDNWPAATSFSVDDKGTLSIVQNDATFPSNGVIASYADQQWKRIKIA